MNEFEEYYNNLKEKLIERKLNNFWVQCGTKEFKPFLKDGNKDNVRKIIENDLDTFKNKCIANISIIFKPRINFSKLKPDDKLLTIKIYIYKVSKEGLIDNNIADSWTLIVHYTTDELKEHKFSVPELSKMVSRAHKKKIISDIIGITYSQYLDSL